MAVKYAWGDRMDDALKIAITFVLVGILIYVIADEIVWREKK
ncbi:hypothetical protein ACQQ6W_23360 [Lysinibacillus fusiformis]